MTRAWRDRAGFLAGVAVGCTGSHGVGGDGGASGQDALVVDAQGDLADASPDAAPSAVPTLLWSATEIGACPDLMTPVFAPPSEPPITRGEARWRYWEREPVFVQAPPTLLGTGLSLWSADRYHETPIDYLTGELGVPFVMDPSTDRPPSTPTLEEIYRYRGTRMSLGGNVMLSRTPWNLLAWSPGQAQGVIWRFPELEALFREEMARPAVDNGTLDHSAPAWSPVTGHVAFAAGLSTSVIAIQCGDGDGRMLLDLRDVRPGTSGRTHLFYRENGELLVHRGRLWVFSPTGELERSVDVGPEAVPVTYEPRCGILYRLGERLFQWWNPDTLSPAPSIPTYFDSDEVSGTFECGVLILGETQYYAFRPGSIRYVDLLAPQGRAIPIPTGYMVSRAGNVDFYDFDGGWLSSFSTLWRGLSVLTPAGSAITSTGRFELDIDDVAYLCDGCGLNWPHTNSPLPGS